MAFKISNLNVVVKDIEELADTDKVNSALEKACLIVENQAKRDCPVDTGQLRNSITHQVSAGEGTIGTNLEYAPYVEYGTGIFATKGGGRTTPWRFQTASGEWVTTRGQAAQPFLMPALEDNRIAITEIIANALTGG